MQHRVQHVPCLFGIRVGNQLHGALEVGKEHPHPLALAFQGGARGEDFLCQIGRGVREWRLSKAFRRSRGGGESSVSIARPDEAVPRIVVDLRIGVEDLILEIVEGVLIQGKLPLEDTICQTPPALEHSDVVVEALLKSHGSPSRGHCGRQQTMREFAQRFRHMYIAPGE
jgi:hypothetical protein